MSEHCFRCHGPSAKEGQAGLRLDLAESATKDRDGRHVIHPGKSSESSILLRIRPETPELAMPPPDSGVKPLSDEDVATIKAWIDQGAKYEKLWSLIPPKSPALPIVQDTKWVRNPIDTFVLRRLEDAGLTPEPEADKATLLRRATLTLTGLQPTPAELDAFLKDGSKNAYDKAVDRLLASPRYGEHQARYWLDAVRYGDTHGLHLDNERAIYPYRDWVVRAYNQDLPYDKFALWQLAGDLLPAPSTDQLIATGYIRMNPTTNEGGAIAEEFQAKNTFDRVDTTSTVFLGLTVACARCHSHKYDPVTQADYYRLFAFFNSTADEPLDGNLFTPDPVLRAPFPEDEKKLKTMATDLGKLEAKVDVQAAQKWLAGRRVEFPTVGKWEVSDQVQAPSFDAAYDTESEPQNWMPVDLKPETPLTFFTKENAYAYLRTTVASAKAQEVGLRLSSDDAIKVWVNGDLVHANKALRGIGQSYDSIRIKLRAGDNAIVVKVANAGGPGGVFYGLGDDTDKRATEVAKLQGKPEGEQALRRLYLQAGPDSPAAAAYREQAKSYDTFLASIPQTLVAKELPKPRPTFVLRRGEYNLPSDPVERAIPESLGSLPKRAPVNRLGFAEWLTAKDNPLFARVFVNRIWQQHFGTGLVKTAEDFGNQGEWPSHPELLDYLATKFAKDGFSLKKLHKAIVTSAAFRQRSSVKGKKLQVDPENRLVSRGPRFRLDAEVLRDQALSASGLLYEKPGGKGFKPYQPAGLWEEVAFLDSTTARYQQDTTQEIYRRSLYLFWKRTSPHPVMLTFDAPMREMCVVRRARTNTPLQALVTMNEPAFLEASREFAERILKGPSKTDDDRLAEAFRLSLGRAPSNDEVVTLTSALRRYGERYANDPASAKELVSVGMTPPDPAVDPQKLAAWTIVCSTLFNLDEFLTQH
ncbi:MAG: PSD1 domain-containing protein [Armatimonadetes bacterium]|nr:PSD1 domain-containing protein [Armatimonadota bacterium]